MMLEVESPTASPSRPSHLRSPHPRPIRRTGGSGSGNPDDLGNATFIFPLCSRAAGIPSFQFGRSPHGAPRLLDPGLPALLHRPVGAGQWVHPGQVPGGGGGGTHERMRALQPRVPTVWLGTRLAVSWPSRWPSSFGPQARRWRCCFSSILLKLRKGNLGGGEGPEAEPPWDFNPGGATRTGSPGADLVRRIRTRPQCFRQSVALVELLGHCISTVAVPIRSPPACCPATDGRPSGYIAKRLGKSYKPPLRRPRHRRLCRPRATVQGASRCWDPRRNSWSSPANHLELFSRTGAVRLAGTTEDPSRRSPSTPAGQRRCEEPTLHPPR